MHDLARRMSELLEEERAALLRNDFQAIPVLAAEKERMMEALTRSGADRLTLIWLGRAAQRNGELLDALARGIRAAARRIREVREGATQGLRTYSQSGERTNVPLQGGRLERRA